MTDHYTHPPIKAGTTGSWPSFALCAELEHLPKYAGYRLWQRKSDGARAYLSATHLMLRGRRPIKHGIRLADGQPVPDGWLLDGELLADSGHATDVLGHVTGRRWKRLRFEAFDILTTESRLMTPVAYEHRWSLLTDLLPAESLVTVHCLPQQEMPPVPPEWEGIVGKLPLHAWRPGRSRDAVKWKNHAFLDAVITGFDAGSGAWAGSVGAVRFGLIAPSGSLLEVGRAGGLTGRDRERFAADPDRYIGRGCRIKHYGMNKTHLRNPVFISVNDEQEVQS